MIKLFGLKPGKEGTSGIVYRGYATIPWTDFDCIWSCVSHNHRKTTINLLYLLADGL
jgi:hypothetical protein